MEDHYIRPESPDRCIIRRRRFWVIDLIKHIGAIGLHAVDRPAEPARGSGHPPPGCLMATIQALEQAYKITTKVKG